MTTYPTHSRRMFLALMALLSGPAWSVSGETLPWPLPALDLAKQRALNIECVNQLKQSALAARSWAANHGDRAPSGIPEFAQELASPTLLYCPANASQVAPTNWADVEWSRIDYEWLPTVDWSDPASPCLRCLVHDNTATVDGLVRTTGRYRGGWPMVVAPPVRQEVTAGASVMFEVRVAPDALEPLHYQWRREKLFYVTNTLFFPDAESPDGGFWRTNRTAQFVATRIEGETNSSFAIASVATEDSDFYSVTVSNALGTAFSSPTLLTVGPDAAFKSTNAYWSAVHCLNNLRQIALFGRMSASDYDEHLPPSLAAMTNYFGQPIFGWPTVLYCRSDQGRIAPVEWAQVDMADTSYEVLPVLGSVDENPTAVFCRCKVHGYSALASGEVLSPPWFSGIRWLSDGSREVAFVIFGGQTSVLEASTDLVRWEELASYSEGKEAVYRDSTPLSARFYRVRMTEIVE